MKSCPQCERAMNRDTSAGRVVYVCFCGTKVEGGAEDVRIAGDVLNAGETEEMYRRLIGNAAHDPVNAKVKKDCPECGLDYMTQIRVGAREVVVWVCKCGYRSSAS